MNQQDIPRFFQALNAMGELFCDEVSEVRQRAYWGLLVNRMTIEEWEYAAEQAMLRESFHKIPLPSQLLKYVQEQRAAQGHQGHTNDAHERIVAHMTAYNERLALEASPEWKRERALQMEEEYAKRKAEQQEITQHTRDTLIALGLINPPNPRRWLPLTDDMKPDEGPQRPRGEHSGPERLVLPRETEEDPI